MGSALCEGRSQPEREQVHSLPPPHPPGRPPLFFRGATTRYESLSIVAQDQNTYCFVLALEPHRELRVSLPVLNEPVHCAVHPNYRLKLTKTHALVDWAEEGLRGCLLGARNEVTGVDYSLRVLPFRGYNSPDFKRALELVWLHRQLTRADSAHFLTLEDAFVYGINPDRQALVLLYERAETSLLEVGLYRNEAHWPWTEEEVARILGDAVTTCLRLQELNLLVRDLRVGNWVFVPQRVRYVLADLGSGREWREEDDDLLTVYGEERENEGKLKELIHRKVNMGLYDPHHQQTHSLLQLLRFLDSPAPSPSPAPLSPPSARLAPLLTHPLHPPPPSPLPSLYRDLQISRLTSRLTSLRDKPRRQHSEFLIYELLGYHKEFSQLAHQVIEKNNQDRRPLRNAPLLRQLAAFYQKNGTAATEYLLNACTLYCKRAEQRLELDQPAQAEEELEQAEELYLQLAASGDFPLSRVELRRLRALHLSLKGDHREAREMIDKAVATGSALNLTLERQMRLFLAWGAVYARAGDLRRAEERFRNGLAICDNAAAFESPASAALTKSHFLLALGNLHLSELTALHDPRKAIGQQTALSLERRAAVEQELTQALDLRKRESSQHFYVWECHRALASFYMMLSQYLQARTHCRQALIQLRLTPDPDPQTLATALYDLGSVCYKLGEYGDARLHYEETIRLLEDASADPYWLACVTGNLGLTLARSGQPSGHALISKAKTIILSQRGPEHYDYVFLLSQQAQL